MMADGIGLQDKKKRNSVSWTHCPECEQKITTRVQYCPYCGQEQVRQDAAPPPPIVPVMPKAPVIAPAKNVPDAGTQTVRTIRDPGCDFGRGGVPNGPGAGPRDGGNQEPGGGIGPEGGAGRVRAGTQAFKGKRKGFVGFVVAVVLLGGFCWGVYALTHQLLPPVHVGNGDYQDFKDRYNRIVEENEAGGCASARQMLSMFDRTMQDQRITAEPPEGTDAETIRRVRDIRDMRQRVSAKVQACTPHQSTIPLYVYVSAQRLRISSLPVFCDSPLDSESRSAFRTLIRENNIRALTHSTNPATRRDARKILAMWDEIAVELQKCSKKRT